jgi:nicotinate-nucleotide pyrophosphorylase (carboxylating)
MFIPWASFFSPEGRKFLQDCIKLALDEDGPDLTAEAIFPPDLPLSATVRAKENTLVVGLPIIEEILQKLADSFAWEALLPEASKAKAMSDVARITAPAAALLRAERIILNFISHLSGIANLTARYVQELEGTGVALLDTRKTTPGLRWPEKYAVQAGGGLNHRKNLTEMLMLKDNHIDAAGSIVKAVQNLRAHYAPCPPIEVECRSTRHVEEALLAKVDRIMLDNMQGAQLNHALSLIPPQIEAEVSGGVCLENIRAIACSSPRRPDFISVGRLTHSAVAADFSMLLIPS